MPIPTSEPGLGGAPLPGLPDLTLLTRLANELFSAPPGMSPSPDGSPWRPAGDVAPGRVADAAGAPTLPPSSGQALSSTPPLGGVSLPVNPQPGGSAVPAALNGPAIPGQVPLVGVVPGANLLPTSPQTAGNLFASRPANVPHAQAGNGLPESLPTFGPAIEPHVGGAALGVPPVRGATPVQEPAPLQGVPSWLQGAPSFSDPFNGTPPVVGGPTAFDASRSAYATPPRGGAPLPGGPLPAFGVPSSAESLPASPALPGSPSLPGGAPGVAAAQPGSLDRLAGEAINAAGPPPAPALPFATGAAPEASDVPAGGTVPVLLPAPPGATPTSALPGASTATPATASGVTPTLGAAPVVGAGGAPVATADRHTGGVQRGDRYDVLPLVTRHGLDAHGAPEPALGPKPSSSGGLYFLDHAGAVPQTRRGQGEPRAAAQTTPATGFDVHAVRRDFPVLSEVVHGRPLAWFDNAATTHKPQAVIDRLAYFYAHENSNIHRAAHELAARATDAYEGARETVQRFIGAASPEEIIFVRGTTEAINLVAKSWGAKYIGPGDEIIVSHLEHHANIVPWQQLAAEKGAVLRVIPVDDSGQVILAEYRRLLGPRTKLVAVTQVSNALGTVVPVQEIVQIAKRQGVTTLVDGAQSVAHVAVDVQALDTDFFVFSGHKIFGPTGIGIVYGKKHVLEATPPWQGGGNMIADVTFERTLYHAPPTRFEAGTGNIADAVGLGAALDYVSRVGLGPIGQYEHDLLQYATQAIRHVPGIRLIGTARDKASVLSFVLDGYTTEQVGQALNGEGIAVRTGHHCAQPILRRFGVEATVRPSLAFYNTPEEVDRFARVVHRLARGRL